jgi:iron-sulfur cluster repair protein YtfE (RIC family)
MVMAFTPTEEVDMAEHPDLTLYRIIHRGMRADTARLAAAVAGMSEAERAGRMPKVVRWYSGFFHDFELHHSAEDELFFPALAERVPEFADRMVRLDAEHHTLEAALVTVGDAVRQLADPEVTWSSVHGDVLDALRTADAELTLHLDHEDEHVLPLFVAHMSKLDYDEISERATKRNSLSDVKFAVSWIMSNATDAERRRLLAEAPLPLKVVWYLYRGRYARLTRRALGETPVPSIAQEMRRSGSTSR